MAQVGNLREGVPQLTRDMGFVSHDDSRVPAGETTLWPAKLNRLLIRMDDSDVAGSGVKELYEKKVKEKEGEEMTAELSVQLILSLFKEKGIPEHKLEKAA